MSMHFSTSASVSALSLRALSPLCDVFRKSAPLREDGTDAARKIALDGVALVEAAVRLSALRTRRATIAALARRDGKKGFASEAGASPAGEGAEPSCFRNATKTTDEPPRLVSVSKPTDELPRFHSGVKPTDDAQPPQRTKPAASLRTKKPSVPLVSRDLVRPPNAAPIDPSKPVKVQEAIGMTDPFEHRICAAMPEEANGSYPRWNALENMICPSRVTPASPETLEGIRGYGRDRDAERYAKPRVSLSSGVGVIFSPSIWTVDEPEEIMGPEASALTSRKPGSCASPTCTGGEETRRMAGKPYCSECHGLMYRGAGTARKAKKPKKSSAPLVAGAGIADAKQADNQHTREALQICTTSSDAALPLREPRERRMQRLRAIGRRFAEARPALLAAE